MRFKVAKNSNKLSKEQQRDRKIPHSITNTSAAEDDDDDNNNNAEEDEEECDSEENASSSQNSFDIWPRGARPNLNLVSVDGIQSGVPTLTTPTLTPTTLRTIDETFMQADLSEPVNIPNQAGFKPPPLGYNMIATQYPINFNNALSSEYIDQQDSASEDSFNGGHYDDSSQATTDNSSAATDTLSLNGLNGIGNNSQTATSTTSSTRNDFTEVNMAIAAAKNSLQFGTNGGTNDMAAQSTSRSGRRGGGRRPQQPSNMSPEEEEKRRLRRERNKQAAARCRKRRVDQTNELQGEVEVLEKKRESLQNSIQQLTKEKEFLNSVIQNHRPYCEKLNNSNILLNTFSSLTTPTSTNNSSTASASLAGTIVNPAITGIDTSLATAGRCPSPLDLKPNINDSLLASIKNEPIDHTLDSSSLDDNEEPPSPKRVLPDVATLKNASLSASLSSLNTPVMTTAPVSFTNYSANSTLNALNKSDINVKPQRPNTFSMQPRNINTLALQVNGRPLTEIQGVPIQTPSTGFNFDSLMEGGTGLTPVSGPLLPTYSQTRHAQELTTPTSEPSKLVSL